MSKYTPFEAVAVYPTSHSTQPIGNSHVSWFPIASPPDVSRISVLAFDFQRGEIAV
jgi:hypothetical protein